MLKNLFIFPLVDDLGIAFTLEKTDEAYSCIHKINRNMLLEKFRLLFKRDYVKCSETIGLENGRTQLEVGAPVLHI